MNNTVDKGYVIDRDIKLLRESRNFREIDLQLAKFVYRQADEHGLIAAMTALLAGHEQSKGHICVNFEDFACRIPEEFRDAGLEFSFPDQSKWSEALLKSGTASSPEEFSPLVIEGGRVYLQRFWRFERQAADRIIARSESRPSGINVRTGQLIDILFADEGCVEQRRAAEIAVTGKFTVIAGGPGTGKTTTVARILYIMLDINPEAVIYITAPTGKAAARLNESIDNSIAKIRGSLEKENPELVNEAAFASLSRMTGMTIHRLIGIGYDSQPPRYNQENLLVCDAVIVDEASMIDTSLMSLLMAALPDSSSVVMLGDRDQLASVEAGSVMADICSSAFTPESRLAGKAVLLSKTWRFTKDSGIGRLSELITSGSAEDVCDILYSGTDPQVSAADVPRVEIEAEIAVPALEWFSSYSRSCDDLRALELYAGFRILSPLRRGWAGVDELNSLVERALAAEGFIPGRSRFYENRPVIITRNDYYSGLFNGDSGIVRQTGDGPKVCFQSGPGSVRMINPSLLPQHETAYAMTVHKSQGSEFDHVVLVLPEEQSGIMTRELIYTAVTRAKKSVRILGSPEVLKASLERRISRASGLAEKLV